MKPEILERQIAHAGYLTVERLRMRLTDGAEVSREVERHGDAAAVLPYDVERRSALVVRLFRAPVLVASGEEMSEEACAGMIENELHLQAVPCFVGPPAAGGRVDEVRARDAIIDLLHNLLLPPV